MTWSWSMLGQGSRWLVPPRRSVRAISLPRSRVLSTRSPPATPSTTSGSRRKAPSAVSGALYGPSAPYRSNPAGSSSMRTTSQGTGCGGRRGRPSSPIWPRAQRDASCLVSSQTPRPSLADSTSDAAPSRVAAVSPRRTRYAAESSASQSLPRRSRRVTTTACSPTGSTWTERSPSVGRPVTGRMAPVSTSSTNGAGSLATSSRSPAASRSETPGSGRAAAWPSWPGRGPPAPGRCQGPARVTTIAVARSSTTSPAASVARGSSGRLGGGCSRCPALVTTLVPDPAGRGSRRTKPTPGCGPSGPGHLALGVPLGQGLALVVGPLASGQAELHLDQLVLEVDAQRDQGQAALLDPRRQLVDLLAVEQELARPGGLMALVAGVGVGGDLHVEDDVAVLQHGVGVLERGLALAQGLDLAAAQDHPGLDGLEDLVVVAGAAVGGHRARWLAPGHCEPPA